MGDEQDQKMEIIGQLMEELQDLMGDSADDFSERLGREKPSASFDDPMGDMKDDGSDDEGMDDDPDDKLKMRIMRLRA